MTRILIGCVLAILLTSATAQARQCSGGLHDGQWAWPDCEEPLVTVGIEGAGIVDVQFIGAPPNINIEAGDDGNGNCTIIINADVSIGDVTVFGSASVSAGLTINASANVGVIALAANSSVDTLHVGGTIAGNLGGLVATSAGSDAPLTPWRVQGNLIGDVTMLDRTAAPDLRLIRTRIDGNILPGVTIDAESGGIGTLLVDGEIGEPAEDPVTILSGLDITMIRAGAIYADINVSYENEEEEIIYGNIRNLITDKLLGTGSGDFVGTIEANSIGQPIERELEAGVSGAAFMDIAGDFLGIAYFHGELANDPQYDVSVIRVGHDFMYGSLIWVLPSGGLSGQIIFNRDDNGGNWESGALVVVGSQQNSGPNYFWPAGGMGGGAAGLAGFGLHQNSCDPATAYGEPAEMHLSGELVLDPILFTFDCVFPKPSLFLDFYGPVERDSGASGLPVLIERYTGSNWVDASGGFDFDMWPSGDFTQIEIWPTSATWQEASYRIRKRQGHLFCREVAEEETDVASFMYYLDVFVTDCGGMLMGYDLNADDAVTTPGDLPVLLVEQVDLSGDAVTDTDDVSVLESAAALYAQPGSQVIYYEGPWDDVEQP